MDRTVEFPGANAPTSALIEYILVRYHETHRRDLPELITLAHQIETIHAFDPNAPHGLTHALEGFIADLEDHMCKEELAVFAALDAERHQQKSAPITALRHEHTGQEAILNKIAAITHGFRLPSYACAPWTRLYAGLSKLVDDLDQHIFLEDTVLFPRFETST